MLENIGGSTLNFRGTGRSAFVSYRETNTGEADSFDQLLQPGGKNVIDLISDRWVTSFEVNGRELYLEQEKNIPLPKRIRFALRIPEQIFIQTVTGDYPLDDKVTDPATSDVYLVPDPETIRLVPWYQEPGVFSR